MTFLLLLVTAISLFVTYHTIKRHRALRKKYNDAIEKINRDSSFNKSDLDAMKGDWDMMGEDFKAVGNDMKQAFRDIAKKFKL